MKDFDHIIEELQKPEGSGGDPLTEEEFEEAMKKLREWDRNPFLFPVVVFEEVTVDGVTYPQGVYYLDKETHEAFYASGSLPKP